MKQEDVDKLNQEIKENKIIQLGNIIFKNLSTYMPDYILGMVIWFALLVLGDQTKTAWEIVLNNTSVQVSAILIVLFGFFCCYLNINRVIKYNNLAKKYNISKQELLNSIIK